MPNDNQQTENTCSKVIEQYERKLRSMGLGLGLGLGIYSGIMSIIFLIVAVKTKGFKRPL